MRVMISQPAEGMGEEQARARAKVIAELEAQGHEVWGELSRWEQAPDGANQKLWQLGRALQDMAAADAVYFMDRWAQDKACRLEYEACALIGEAGIPRKVFLEEDGGIIQEKTDTGISFRALDNKIKVLCDLLGIQETDLDKLLETNPDKFGGGLAPNGYYGHFLRVAQFAHEVREFMSRLQVVDY